MPKTYKFKSKSRPGLPHTVTLSDDDVNISCSCESFMYSRATPAECRHTEAVRDGSTGDWTPPAAYDGSHPISPMLASKPLAGKSVADYSREEWALEEKFDGHRLILTTRAGENPLAWSRVGNARELPPHLVSSIKTFVPDGTFDGELYLPGGTSTDVKALENAEKLSLVFFDVLRVENANVMDLGGIARRQMLQHVGAKLEHAQGYGNAEGLSVAPQYDPTEENLHMLWNRGGEGGILKRKDAAYEPGKRSKAWLKLKKEGTTRMTVIGFVPGLLGPHAMIQLRDDMGVEITVKSLNDAWRADFAVNADAYVGRRLVIAFQERTRDGKYRHPMAEYFEEER